ncbi:hypothetical protein [Sphingomonas sp. J315]|uniref:hypothetical protein n=1 Tax=Sphingomonas sp. J315 TaxID=2898433 RepID=UPI0021ADCA75|nr:hypothetical protein [Sphingomonas sp. J315]UUX98761.1 hypothetical protein LRS08_14715 [Sphingomonas sp. J315]
MARFERDEAQHFGIEKGFITADHGCGACREMRGSDHHANGSEQGDQTRRHRGRRGSLRAQEQPGDCHQIEVEEKAQRDCHAFPRYYPDHVSRW